MNVVNLRIIRGYGKLIQKTVSKWLNQMTTYDAIKYHKLTRTPYNDSTGRQRNSLTLADIIKLVHVKPANRNQQRIFNWILTNRVNDNSPTQLIALERLRNISSASKETAEIVTDNILPLNIIKTMIGTNKRAWKKAFLTADFNTVIENINDFNRYGVFKNAECKSRAIELFSNTTTIRKSGLFPHKFIEVYDALDGAPGKLLDAVEKAIEISYISLPEIDKTIAILVSKNNLMSETLVTSSPPVTALNAASAFASIITKIAKKTYIVPFASRALVLNPDPNKNSITIANNIFQADVGNSTGFKLGFTKLKKDDIKVDTLIAINVSHRWDAILRDTDAGDELSDYLNATNENTQMLFITANLQNEHIERHSIQNAHFLLHWNEDILKYIFYLFTDYSDIMYCLSC